MRDERRGITRLMENQLLRHLIWFACACLISTVLLEYSALLGFACAAVGGVGLGILLFRGNPP